MSNMNLLTSEGNLGNKLDYCNAATFLKFLSNASNIVSEGNPCPWHTEIVNGKEKRYMYNKYSLHCEEFSEIPFLFMTFLEYIKDLTKDWDIIYVRKPLEFMEYTLKDSGKLYSVSCRIAKGD